ncbi:hypothetical protein CRYUN_Cryun12cG0095400 [Craigia yunnanensis]
MHLSAELFVSKVDEVGDQPGSVPNNSTEKKRLVDTITGETAIMQGFQSKKKSKQVPDFQGQSRLSFAINDNYDSKQQGGIGNSGKHRRSRWDPQPVGDGHTSEHDQIHKVRKTRWASDEPQLKVLGSVKVPDLMKNCCIEFELDPEVQKLKADLSEINDKLQKPELHDDRPEHERSPSPEPLYNNLGMRISTREVRLRQKLIQKRLDITSRLIQKNSDLEQKRPCDYINTKLCEKLYVPVKEYPGYNFIGLILGPQGNTLKRMEKESGAKILLRGKGLSVKDIKLSSENEDLHVRIQADDKKSLDAAVQMVKKLLIPVAEGMNEHKRAQLAELAKLKKDASGCNVCGEKGHRRYCCPSLQSTFMGMSCDNCGSNSHLTTACPVPTQNKPNKRVDDASLYVGYLPQVVDQSRLKELFSPFGKLTEAKVIRDQTTDLSKCYGFVKFENPTDAAAAVTHLNGYKMDGKMLAVRVAGIKPALGPSAGNPLTQNPGPAAVSQIVPSHVAWPVPPGSSMQYHQASFPQVEDMNLFQASCYAENTQLQPKSQVLGLTPALGISSFHEPSSISGLFSENSVRSSSSSSNVWFPGNPVYGSSQFEPYFNKPTLESTPALHLSQTQESNLKPLPRPTAHLPH